MLALPHVSPSLFGRQASRGQHYVPPCSLHTWDEPSSTKPGHFPSATRLKQYQTVMGGKYRRMQVSIAEERAELQQEEEGDKGRTRASAIVHFLCFPLSDKNSLYTQEKRPFKLSRRKKKQQEILHKLL